MEWRAFQTSLLFLDEETRCSHWHPKRDSGNEYPVCLVGWGCCSGTFGLVWRLWQWTRENNIKNTAIHVELRFGFDCTYFRSFKTTYAMFDNCFIDFANWNKQTYFIQANVSYQSIILKANIFLHLWYWKIQYFLFSQQEIHNRCPTAPMDAAEHSNWP